MIKMKGLLSSLKGMFWFGAPDDLDDKKEKKASRENKDVFYLTEDAKNYEERIKALSSYFEDEFDSPEITINDPSAMEKYIDLNLELRTARGKLRLVYYENDELIIRGDQDLVSEMKEPIGKRLDLKFKRV